MQEPEPDEGSGGVGMSKSLLRVVDGYVNEVMTNFKKEVDEELDDLRRDMNREFDKRITREETLDRFKRLEDAYKIQFNENQGLIATVQQDMDQIFSKFRISSQEMLVINKSFTSSLKQQKGEVAELKEQAKLTS